MSTAYLTLCVLALESNLLAAGGRPESEFPYKAAVQADSVEVRSGPGDVYYATGRLKYGDPVTVHRHDRGGWYMITPPPGSISFIRVEHVTTTDGKTGVVSMPDYGNGRPALAVVRIGSTLSDDAAFSGRQLGNGDRVTILGRQMVKTDAGDVEMFKIEPPDREYRWVKGDFIARAGDFTPRTEPAIDQDDPFSSAVASEFGTDNSLGAAAPEFGQPPSASSAPAANANRPRNPDPNALLVQRQKLQDVDDRFRATVGGDPGSWRLDELERDYKLLEQQALTETFVGQVRQRLAAIARRRDVLKRYNEFIRLTQETSEREQKLLALQEAAGVKPSSDQAVDQTAGSQLGSAGSIPAQPAASSEKRRVATMPRLDGAGLVQSRRPRIPGGPRHAILATDGRTLAFLVSSAGINLDEHVGQERGIVGQRTYDRRLKGDVIDVQRLVPVRLQQ